MAGSTVSQSAPHVGGAAEPDGEPSVPVGEPIDVLIVTTMGGGGIHQYVDQFVPRLGGDIEVRVFDMYSDPTGSGVKWALESVLRSGLAVLRFPLQRPPDVVHVHTSHGVSFLRASVYVLLASILWRCSIMIHVHGSSFDAFVDTDRRAVGSFQRLVFTRCDRIVVLSEYWRAVLAQIVDPERVVVVPNAVDVERYAPRYDPEKPRVVFVSNLIDRKGVAEFVEATDWLLETLAMPFEVHVAGDGPRADRVRALEATHEAVVYHGYVDEAAKRALLERGSIFALPTHAEGLPFALLEGMAGGNAVVSTRVGSIPEVIGEEGGILIDPGDTDALVRALRQLITAPTRTTEMGQRNRTLVREQYDWLSVTATMARLYDEHAGEPARPGADAKAGPAATEATTD